MKYNTTSIHTLIPSIIQFLKRGILFSILLTVVSCKKFVEVGTPGSKITSLEVFKEDASATAAVLGIYSQMSAYGLIIMSGSVTVNTALTSDELTFSGNNPDLSEFQANSISSNNYTSQYYMWAMAYKFIYQANACINGISESTTLTPKTKNQLLGECRLVRSFIYSYLVQLYGDVPLITATDYTQTSVQGRTPTKDIYDFIINDLTEAKNQMSETSPSDGRLRPNKYSASALLARVYLYIGNWKAAEDESNTVISSSKYSLQSDLNKVFLAGSTESIWQTISTAFGTNTREGATFIPTGSSIPAYLISAQLLNAFEPGDPRKASWLGSKTIANNTYYYPFKYKIPLVFSTAPPTENYTMLRLAEQFLIRGEAKIRQGKINDGIGDINILRKRARGNNPAVLQDYPSGLPLDSALSCILKERRVELMVEWGHRWADIKRFQIASKTLQPIKSKWQDTDTLFPVPNQEIILNPNLTQNAGYN